MKKITRSSCWICLTLLCLTACVDNSRQPRMTSDSLPDVYAIELWSEHGFYEFGEPINLRATLTNISQEAITFGEDSAAFPVLDIHVTPPGGIGTDEHTWSSENLDQVRKSITLAPQESYVITWTLSLSLQTSYAIEILWIDPRENAQFSRATGIAHGNREPTP